MSIKFPFQLGMVRVGAQMMRPTLDIVASIDGDRGNLTRQEADRILAEALPTLPSQTLVLRTVIPALVGDADQVDGAEIDRKMEAAVAEILAANKDDDAYLTEAEAQSLSPIARGLLEFMGSSNPFPGVGHLRDELRLGIEKGLLTITEADFDAATAAQEQVRTAMQEAGRKPELPRDQWPKLDVMKGMVTPSGETLIPAPVPILTLDPPENQAGFGLINPTTNEVFFGLARMGSHPLDMQMTSVKGPAKLPADVRFPQNTNVGDRAMIMMALMGWPERSPMGE
jgi:hypothetical protein